MPKDINQQINYLLKITDKVGVIEHCRIDAPNYDEGYCVDDNARALQAALRLGYLNPDLAEAGVIYFNFLKLSAKTNGCHNDLNHDLTWKKDSNRSGEHYGRALSALGELSSNHQLSGEAVIIFDKLYSPDIDSSFVRVWSQIIFGLKNRQNTQDIAQWADLTVNKYQQEKSDGWKWYEPSLSYDNGRPPMGLLTAYQVTKNEKYLSVALESLDFLTDIVFDKSKDYFIFPGNQGWIDKNGFRAIFDQQPIEAGSMTECYCLAYLVTHDTKYRELAVKSFDWYHGKNISGVSLINPVTGGIYDGLTAAGVNLNQGAESILSYLLGWVALKTIIG